MLKKSLLLIVFVLFFISCTSKTEKLQTKKEINRNKSATSVYKYLQEWKIQQDVKLDQYIKSMPLEERIAQMFIENLEGCKNFRSYETFSKITGDEKNTKPIVAGGYLFFGYNIAPTVLEQQAFSQSIQNYALENNQILPYLSVDQEGGWVNRLKKLTGPLPSQEQVAQNMSSVQAFDLYSSQAISMKELGFNMNIAPVIEVCNDNNKEFLDGRSFGSLFNTVEYGKACVNAYEFNSIGTVIKHFPGNTNTDPHTGLPEITDSKAVLLEAVEGFKQIIQSNAFGKQPAGVLMSHARTSAIDPGVPACLSKIWVTDILRNEWGYEGIIFSDDIFMGALADNGYPPEVAVVKAVEAGIDSIMTSEKRFGNQAKVLYNKAKADAEFENKINTSVKRILKYKIDCGLFTLE